MKILFSLLLSLGVVSAPILAAAAEPVTPAEKQEGATSQAVSKVDPNSQDAKKIDAQPVDSDQAAAARPTQPQGAASTESASGSSSAAAQPATGGNAATSSAAVVGEAAPAAKP